MSLVAIYGRGEIKDIETTLKKHRGLKPRPGLLTSFSNRVGAVALGILLIALGVFCSYFLFTERLSFFRTVVMIFGALCVPLGLWILAKAFYAFGKSARAHSFFYYDDSRIVMGTTKPIEQADIKRIQKARKPERIGMLMTLAPGCREIPVKAIEHITLHVAKPQLNVHKMTITGAGAAIAIDFDALLPSLNFSGINGDIAFNSISQYYTRATGNTLPASIENP